MSRLGRVASLALAAIVVSAASAAGALVIHSWRLPPSDGAYGEPPFGNSIVNGLVVALAVATGLVGYALALWLLWRTELTRSVPVVALVTVGTALLVATSGLAVFVPPIALLAGVLTMLECRDRARSRQRVLDGRRRRAENARPSIP